MSWLRALVMSYTVSAATDTAVSASISTPVLWLTATSARMFRPCAASSYSSSSLQRSSIIGWHSGIRPAVFLAAMMPASRATSVIAPLAVCPLAAWIWAYTFGGNTTRPAATATRRVTALSPTSTMLLRLCWSKCVSKILSLGYRLSFISVYSLFSKHMHHLLHAQDLFLYHNNNISLES